MAYTDELARMRAQTHKWISVFDYDGKEIPCIVVNEEEHDQYIAKTAGSAFSVSTNLDILHDGFGHVFVDMSLTFSISNIHKKYLIDASKHIEFFECLAKSSIFAITSHSPYSPKSEITNENILMVQLPRVDLAVSALKQIKYALSLGSTTKQKDGAVTGI